MLKRFIGYFYAFLVLAFLYTPLIILVVMSFNASQYKTLPLVFSTKWYTVMFNNATLMTATKNSLIIGFLTAIICIILGTALMMGERDLSKKLRKWISSLSALPLIIPWIILGLSLLLLLSALGIRRNLTVLLIGHVIVSFPYMILVLSARMENMNREVEEASQSLGADYFTTFRRITMPMIFPAILTGGFLSFLISFDNFAISYFLIPSGQSTLPIEIYSSVKFGYTPEINAISTIILVATLLIIGLTAFLMKSSIKNLLSKGE